MKRNREREKEMIKKSNNRSTILIDHVSLYLSSLSRNHFHPGIFRLIHIKTRFSQIIEYSEIRKTHKLVPSNSSPLSPYFPRVRCSVSLLAVQLTYLACPLFQAKLETKALKAKRPGFTDERYNETSYYVENGEY